jgi:hypothetical protein
VRQINFKPVLRIAMATAVFTLTGQTALAQTRKDSTRPPCSRVLFSRRIVLPLGIVEFRVPRFASVSKSVDVDYVIYSIHYGGGAQKAALTMMLGPLAGGHAPRRLEDKSITWKPSKWNCPHAEGGVWRGVGSDGLLWRHLGIPMSGFAGYERVSPKAAAYFDKILDSMCCGKCEICE